MRIRTCAHCAANTRISSSSSLPNGCSSVQATARLPTHTSLTVSGRNAQPNRPRSAYTPAIDASNARPDSRVGSSISRPVRATHGAGSGLS